MKPRGILRRCAGLGLLVQTQAGVEELWGWAQRRLFMSTAW